MPPEPEAIAMDVLPPPTGPALSATSDRPTQIAEPALSEEVTPATARERGPDGKFKAAEKEVDEPVALSDTSETDQSDEATGADQKPDEVAATDKKAESRVDPATRAGFARRDAEIAQLRANVAQLQESEARRIADQAPKAQPKPDYQDFPDPQSYEDALVKWASDEGARAAAERVAQEQIKAAQKAQADAVVRSWNDRVEVFETEYRDFRDVVGADDLRITPAMTAAIAQIDNGPAVAYHLGKNKTEAVRIANLDPMRAAIEIGKLSDRLESAVTKPARRLPNPQPDRGTRSSPATKDPDKMSMDEFANDPDVKARTAWNSHRN